MSNPILVMNWLELSSQTILDMHDHLADWLRQNHAIRKPVWQLNAKWDAVVTWKPNLVLLLSPFNNWKSQLNYLFAASILLVEV